MLNGTETLLTASGAGNGKFNLRVLKNITGQFRHGTLVMAGVTYTISQERYNDTTPPTVSVVAPLQDAVVASTIEIVAASTDNIGVIGVQFSVNGVVVGEDVSAPYAVGFDTTLVADGRHTIAALARDGIGNSNSGFRHGVSRRCDSRASAVSA